MITPDGKKNAAFWSEHIDPESRENYIRSYDMQNPSRPWVIEQLRDGESLLDVGCGPSCTVYSDVMEHGLYGENPKTIHYKGVDVTASFIESCQTIFPGVDFEVQDAMNLQEEDNSFDTVLLRHVLEHTPYYEQPIREAIRVAKRRVIIIMWRPLLSGDKPDLLQWEVKGSNDYNSTKFSEFLGTFVLPQQVRTFKGVNNRKNWGWILSKTQYETVFDLDDFHTNAPHMDLLFRLKKQYPKLKVTLFGIPSKLSNVPWRDNDWIELAVHGWTHHPNTECEDWTGRQAHYWLNQAEKMGIFVKGFRPPGWRINHDVIDVLKNRGYWSSLEPVKARYAAQIGLPNYTPHEDPESVHGHMQNIHNDNPYLRNGLSQLIHERGFPQWDQDTEFKFVSEVVQ